MFSNVQDVVGWAMVAGVVVVVACLFLQAFIDACKG
ncbi:hypothetical protein KOCBH_01879 [Klebsiella michiganensis]|nr:hypothetical protein KOCBH_01879 [Klebsiella michiganensis]